MHSAELTFTPTTGAANITFPLMQSWSQQLNVPPAAVPRHHPSAPASPTTPRYAQHASAQVPPWPQEQEQNRVPEYLTRRFVEKASQNRLRLLKKRLAEGQERLFGPWKSQSSSPNGRGGNADLSRPRSWTPPPRSRPSAALTFETNNVARTRPRSATPPAAWGRTAAWAEPLGQQPNLLRNDFIQFPAAGTYRHLEKQYTTDYSTVEDRLNKVERWCRDFKQTYSPRTDMAMYRQADQGAVTPAARLAAHSKQPQPQYAAASAGASRYESPAWHTNNVSAASPASTVMYSPPRDKAAAIVPASAIRPAGEATPAALQLPRHRLWEPQAVGAADAGALGHMRSTLAPPSFHPQAAKPAARVRAAHISSTATARPSPDVLPSRARSPAAAVISPARIRRQVATYQRPAAAGRDHDIRHGAFNAAAAFPSTVAEAGSSVASHGGLEAWSEGMRQAWHQMEQLPKAKPTWVFPVDLVPPSSLLKFGAGLSFTQQGGLGSSGRGGSSLNSTAAYDNGRRAAGLSHRERLQAGIRDLQTEMGWLRAEMGLKGIYMPAVDYDLRRATTPGPGKMWG